MAGSPGGKSVGRVSIRVLPDTSDFKQDLKKKLDVIQKQIHFTVNVDKAKVDKVKLRESIESQIATMNNVATEVNVKALVTGADVRKVEVRQSLQKQFDDMGLVVKVGVDLTRAKADVKKFVHDINKKDATVNVNVATAAATAQMKWLTRDRFVTIIPRISQSAAKKLSTQLIALSGGRVAFDWVKDVTQWVERLDQTLPKLSLIVGAIGSLVSVSASAISGLLGVGAGLAAIAPLALLIPGIILGLSVAVASFAIAMKDAKTELVSLKPAMHDIANIIQSDFWGAAKEPILNLVNSLLPQLRVAFGEVSTSLGNFTAKFAEAFQKELSGGKLRELFSGIAKSFDILATGTDSFASAIVSLSAVAAKYSPRLAQWFVDIADRFDTWLTAVSNDGRLDAWVENGITNLKALGSAFSGVGRIFSGLWDAAEAAGGGGLPGFAHDLNVIADIIESRQFQAGLTTFFKGAAAGSKYIDQALKDIGQMFYDLRDTWATVVSQVTAGFGILLSAFAKGLDNPEVAKGLTDFADGIEAGLAGFATYLPGIVEGMSHVASFAGSLAEYLGPSLGAALSGLGEALGPFLDFLRDKVLPKLGPRLLETIEKLTPVVADFLVDLEPLILALADILDALLYALPAALQTISDIIQSTVTGPLTMLFDPDTYNFFDSDAQAKWDKKAQDGVYGWIGSVAAAFDSIDPTGIVGQKFWTGLWTSWSTGFAQWRDSVLGTINQWWADVRANFADFRDSFPAIVAAIWNAGLTAISTGIGTMAKAVAAGAVTMFNAGVSLITGLINGIKSMIGKAVKAVTDIAGAIPDAFAKLLGIRSPSRVFAALGAQIPAGLALGIDGGNKGVAAAINRMVAIPDAAAFSPLAPALAGGFGGSGDSFTANFNLAPSTAPLADQVFMAAQRLKARTLNR